MRLLHDHVQSCRNVRTRLEHLSLAADSVPGLQDPPRTPSLRSTLTQFDFSVLGQQHVLSLDVTVDDMMSVQVS